MNTLCCFTCWLCYLHVGYILRGCFCKIYLSKKDLKTWSYYIVSRLRRVDLRCLGLRCLGLRCLGLRCLGLHCLGLHCLGLHCLGLRCLAIWITCRFSSVVERYPCKVVVASSILAGGLFCVKLRRKVLLYVFY